MSRVLSSLLAPALAPFYRAVADRIARYTGEPVAFVEGLEEAFDFAFVCSPRLVRDRTVVPVAAPVPGAARYGGRPVYFSDVVVASDHEARSIDDLRDARWAVNEGVSYSGFGALIWYAHERWGGLVSYERTGAHAVSIDRVIAGELDAAAIDSILLDALLRDDPRVGSRLRVVGSIGPAPIQPLVMTAAAPSRARDAARAAVTSMHEDPVCRPGLAHAGIDRLVAVERGDYAVIASRLPLIERA